MTRQSSNPNTPPKNPPDETDSSEDECPSPEPRLNKNQNENSKDDNDSGNETHKENETQSNKRKNETVTENNNEENPNITMDVEESNLPPKKRKRKLRKMTTPLKRTKTTQNDDSSKNNKDNENNNKHNDEEKKTGAIIISLYDLLNMTEQGFGPPQKEPKTPNDDGNYNAVPYDYQSQNDEDYADMEVEEYLNLEIKNIGDLIKIGEDYLNGEYCPYKKYNINVQTISKLVNPLRKLEKMIGMQNVKQDVFELLLYQLQEFDNSKDMLHTIIEGEPGVGKTDLAKIMAEIYQEMGYCSNKIVKFVKRSDLVGGYLGQTAIKTQKVLDECKGGILVIDEAYSLGSPDGRDSYSKECIDTLTSFLSESPDTIVFIMGYHDDLEKSLFAMNKGLERRFSYRFTVKKYSPAELRQILFKIIREHNWDVQEENNIPVEFFEKNEKYFIFNGGDMLNLFTKCKFTHSRRFFEENKKSTLENNISHLKKKISYGDIKKAFKLLQKDEKFNNRDKQTDKIFETTFYT